MYEDQPQDKVFDVLGRPGSASSAGPRDHRDAPRRGRHRRWRPQRLPRGSERAAQRRGARGRGRSTTTALVQLGATTLGDPGRRARRRRRPSPPDVDHPARRGFVAKADRAVPRVPRRRRASPATTTAASRCAILDTIFGGNVVLAPLPGGAREPRRSRTPSSVLTQLHAGTGQVGLYLGTRADNVGKALGVVADELAPPAGRSRRRPRSSRRAKEYVKGRVVLGARVHAGADEPPRRVGAGGTCRSLPVDELVERIDAVTARRPRAGSRPSCWRRSAVGARPSAPTRTSSARRLTGRTRARRSPSMPR